MTAPSSPRRLTARPQTNQTNWQYEVEAMYADAVNAEPGIKTPADAEVPGAVKVALLGLAGALVPYVDAPKRLNPNQYGVPLSRVTRPTGEAYVIHLVTHHTTASGPRSPRVHLLVDGAGPGPEEYLDGFRFIGAYRGLLRLLEREIVSLRDGDDWNWSAGGAADDSLADPEEWHPDEMLRDVRRMRRELTRIKLVDEVHDL